MQLLVGLFRALPSNCYKVMGLTLYNIFTNNFNLVVYSHV